MHLVGLSPTMVMASHKRKRTLIHISSSSSDQGDSDEFDSSSSSASEDEYQLIDDDDEEEEEEEEEEDDDDDDDDDDELYEVDDSDEEEDDDSVSNGSHGIGDDDEDALYNRVIQYLQEKRDLRKLSLNACKAYLRRLGLRVSGNKDVCMKRVEEHWRIKDGEAEGLYTRSSFTINCTGDVCKGDVVLFTQKVYGSFDKVTRNGKLLGKRTVAGRVVKESYGAAKQQHTFTVEVLWSKGEKKLPPLFPLLVKGRNLYRLKTYRQPWKKEAERRKVLDEKHRRGAVARSKREKRKMAKGGKSQKSSQSTKPSQTSYSRKDKLVDRNQRASSWKHSSTRFNNKQPAVKQGAGAHTTKVQSKPIPRQFPDYQVSSSRYYADSSQNYSAPFVGSCNWSMPLGSTSGEFQRVIPYHVPTVMPIAQYNGFGHHIQTPQMTHESSCQFSRPRTVYGQRNTLSRCSTQGCYESRSDQCVIAACQRCCRMKRIRCYVHR